MLNKKINSYESFNSKYPGYGGFLPWITVDGANVEPTYDWKNRVPSLDNGELFWAMYGLVEILETKYPDQKVLIKKWNDAINRMATNSVKIFYEVGGLIRTVAAMTDMTRSVDQNKYTREQATCDFDNPCYLDDPYEGEMFAVMMTLFAPIKDSTEILKIWTNKRAKL